MDSTKFHRLMSADPTITHDDVRQLSPAEAGRLRAKLEGRVALGSSQDGWALSLALRAQRQLVAGPNAESETFTFSDCLLRAGIAPQERLCLNWMQFIEIDSIPFDVLTRHFDDFWYPKADDIDVFDETCQWVLSIDCDGFAWVVKF